MPSDSVHEGGLKIFSVVGLSTMRQEKPQSLLVRGNVLLLLLGPGLLLLFLLLLGPG